MTDCIRVVGAHENNLKNVSVDFPKRRLTAIAGVSGSGKSSLVFSTVAAESRRLINETYSAFVQGFMPTMARPDVDSLEGLTTAITIDQEQLGAGPRSTVGTAKDATAMLRVLFSRIADPNAGGPGAYSFNVPSVSGSGVLTDARGTKKVRKKYRRTGGMCPDCEGTGRAPVFDIADHVVELGPGAGEAGGQVTFTGSVEELRGSDTVTGRHLYDTYPLKPDDDCRAGTGQSKSAGRARITSLASTWTSRGAP